MWAPYWSDNEDRSPSHISYVKPDDYHPQYQPLYEGHEAIQIGDWEETERFLNDHPEALTAKISFRGSTPLHVAAAFEHLPIVEGLVELLSKKELELKDEDGLTPLYCATSVGINPIAQCMVDKNMNLLAMPDPNGMLPVTLAVMGTHMEMARYLYRVTPLGILLPENGPYGAMLLIQCLITECLDLALDLLKRCRRLAITPAYNKRNFVNEIATMPYVFPSGCRLRFFQKWIYNWINIESAVMVSEIRIDVQNSNTRASGGNISPVHVALVGLKDRTVWTFLDLLGIKQIYETKLIHKQSQELLRITCEQIRTLNAEQLQECGLFTSIIEAAQYGIHEFVTEITKAQPELAWSGNNVYRNLFYSTIHYRQAKVFSMIYGFIWKDQATITFNPDRFTMLHMAGKLAPQGQLNRISGAALQMQRELQWFKEVESIVPPAKQGSMDKDNLTAKDLFTKEHKDLVREGEKWMKETATSCTVVGALIVTIMFAAAFTVPGGNNQDTGYPIFKGKNSFTVFIISDAISLFSSSTSVLMFLGILTSRYAEDDFLKSLPTKLIIGLSLLFISIATMMATFCAALFLMLEGKLWIIAPVILLAIVFLLVCLSSYNFRFLLRSSFQPLGQASLIEM